MIVIVGLWGCGRYYHGDGQITVEIVILVPKIFGCVLMFT